MKSYARLQLCKRRYNEKSSYRDDIDKHCRKYLDKIVEKYKKYEMISSGIIS